MLFGISTALSGVKNAVSTIVKDGLKLFYNFTNYTPDILLDGATSFDGDNDKIDCGANFDFSSGNFTLSAWIYHHTDNASAGGIVGIRVNQTTPAEIQIYMDTNDKLTSWNGSSNVSTTSTIPNKKWTHIAVVQDNSNKIFYIDGALDSTHSQSNGASLSETLKIGHTGHSSEYYLGRIANVGIWNRALSSSEIESIMWRGSYSELEDTELTNLVSWYNLSADVNDSTGTNNGTNNGATILTDSYSANSIFKPRIQDYAKPKTAQQLSDGSTDFDGTNDRIIITDDDSLTLSGGFTFSAWVYIEDKDTFSILTKGIYNSNWEYTFRTSNLGKLELYVGNGSTGFYQVIGTTVLTEYKWNHIVVTYNGDSTASNSSFGFYLNGSSDAISYNAGSLSGGIPNTGADVIIGNYDSLYANGSMANVGIWSRVLTQNQIQEVMFSEKYAGLSTSSKTNLVSWYDLGNITQGEKFTIASAVSDSNGNETDSLGNFEAVSSPSLFEVSGTGKSDTTNNVGNYAIKTTGGGDGKGLRDLTLVDGGLTIGASYTLSFDYKMASGIVQFILQKGTSAGGIANTYNSLNSTSWASYSTTFTATEDDVRFYLYQYGSTSATWYFDNLSLKEVQAPDSAGSNDGTIVGATTNTGYTSAPHGVTDPLNYGTIHSGTALDFDGTNDYITLDGLKFDGNQASLGFWVNFDTIEANAFLIDFNPNRFIIGLNNTDGQLGLYDGASWKSFGSLTAGVWNHIVVVLNNTTAIAYVNGVQLGSNLTITAINVASATDCVIGANFPPNDSYVDAKISSVKVFDSVLTQAQVRELYLSPEKTLPTGISSSALKLDMPMQEGSGTVVHDGSPVIIDIAINGDFSADSVGATSITGWSLSSCTAEIIADGYSGNAVKITRTGDGSQYIYQDISGVVSGNQYKVTAYARLDEVYTGSEGTQPSFNLRTTTPTYSNPSQSSSVLPIDASWKQYTHSFTAQGTTARIELQRLESDPGSIRIDSVAIEQLEVGQNHGTISGATWIYGNSDGYQNALVRSNKPMIFDGSNDYVDTGNSFNTTFIDSFTISAWLKPSDGQPSSAQTIMGTAKYDTYSGYLFFRLEVGGQLRVIHGTHSGKEFNKTSSVVFSDGENSWKHCVLIFTKASDTTGTMKIYANGVEVLNDSSPGTGWNLANYTNTYNLFIGARNQTGTANQFYSGLINEVAIWDKTLTANEISAIYNNGLPINLLSNSGNYTSSEAVRGYWRNNGVTTWTDLTPTETPELVTNGTFDNNSSWTLGTGWAIANNKATHSGGVSGDLKQEPIGLVSGRLYEVTFTLSDRTAGYMVAYLGSGTSLGSINTNGTHTLTDTASGNVNKFEISGVGAFDGSISNLSIKEKKGDNHGTASGSPSSALIPESNLTDTYISGSTYVDRDSQGFFLNDTSKVENGIKLNGNEYINIQDSEVLSFGDGVSDKPFSLEAWIKPDDVTNFEVFAKGVYNSTGEYVFGFEPDDKLKFYLFDESVASTYEGVLYNTALTSYEGQWMHIVGTYDGRGGTSACDGMKIYLNGSQVNNLTESGGTYVAMENLSANLEIGKYSSNYAKGSIDEAKVYAKELSASEVTKNYKRGLGKHS